jgi:hypothetical protein
MEENLIIEENFNFFKSEILTVWSDSLKISTLKTLREVHKEMENYDQEDY